MKEKCDAVLEWEQFQGVMTRREVDGVSFYNFKCPKCRIHGFTDKYYKLCKNLTAFNKDCMKPQH